MVKLSLIAQLRYYLLAGIRPARREWVFMYPLSRRRRSSLYLELLPGWVGGIKIVVSSIAEICSYHYVVEAAINGEPLLTNGRR